jgi:hypothetical protein
VLYLVQGSIHVLYPGRLYQVNSVQLTLLVVLNCYAGRSGRRYRRTTRTRSRSYLTESVREVVLQKSISVHIRQRILYYY